MVIKDLILEIKNIDFKKLLKSRSPKISQKQKIFFFDSLYNLINSGIPLTNSLSIIQFQSKEKNIKYLVDSISKDINKGKKLYESFASFENTFSNFDLSMIKMGEVTGKLSNSFEIIKDREEQNAQLKSKVIGALIYPAIITTLSIGMIIGFMLFVIPRVQKMYSDARVNLPSLTQNVINISQFLQQNYLYLIIGVILMILFLAFLKKNNLTKIYVDKIILKFPVFGRLIRKKILAIFSHTLGTLLQNGIMINEALEISKKSLENAYYERKIDEISKELNEGIPLSELIGIRNLKIGKDDPYFPIELASIVKIGEQTGKLPSLLIKISAKFNKEVDVIVKGLSNIIEPIVIIIVGSIVGTMVMAILLPFFNMVNVV
ncbi:MAG: type II secretion system F family protein [Candidatus Gracilibacteria bacterium]|nr:type II secretion system F family protein [Candidatus Gracilibacteria bacterium]